MESIGHRTMVAVRGAESFESAADVLLDAVMRVATAELARIAETRDYSWSSVGPVAASIWFRAREGFRGRRLLASGSPEADPRPSVTLWRRVSSSHAPVTVVLETSAFSVLDGDQLMSLQAGTVEEHGFAEHTRRLLVVGAATHVAAWPVQVPEGLVGVFTLELAVPPLRFEEFALWPGLLSKLVGPTGTAAVWLRQKPFNAPPPVSVPDWAGERMRGVLRTLHAYAGLDNTVLLQGPSGTGKSRLARFIHDRSRRAGRPFCVVHAAAVPSTLFAAHVFGAVKGAWTGLKEDMVGVLVGAEGGTVVLDDIHKAPLESQAALLQLLEDSSYRVVGAYDQLMRSDVRFIAASSADLEAEARAGRFIPDLMFRLQDLVVEIPPLSERREEIQAWARVFAEEVHKRTGLGGQVSFDQGAMEVLQQRTYPGNLRGLESAVNVAYALAAQEIPLDGATGPCIRARHVPPSRSTDLTEEPTDAVRAFERAADAFIRAAQRARAERGEALRYEENARELKSLVLLRAVEQLGRDEAFRLLDIGQQLEQGNAQRAILTARKNWDKVRCRLSSV